MYNLEYLPCLLAVLFYSCSGIMDALMDTIKDHFSESIFSKLNQQFWNPSVSWTNKYKNHDHTQGHATFTIFGIRFNTIDAFSDAWHISKVIREGYIVLAILSIFFCSSNCQTIQIIITFISLLIFRNAAFVLFYNRIFMIKKW